MAAGDVVEVWEEIFMQAPFFEQYLSERIQDDDRDGPVPDALAVRLFARDGLRQYIPILLQGFNQFFLHGESA